MSSINSKSFLALFILVFSFFISSAQKSEEEQVKEVIIESFESILSRFEKDRILDFYTEDFLLLELGEVWNNDTVMVYLDRALQQDPLPQRVNEFDFIKMEVSGNYAWVAYHNHAVISVGSEVVRDIRWLESATLIKTEKGWRIQMLHSTKIPSE